MRRDAKCGALITIALILSTGSTHPQTGGTCVAASERATFEFGCFITARTILRELPSGPLFWHLDRYPDNAAAEAAKGPNGTVVQSFGTVWLFTIAVAGWKSSTGERVAEIGPLPLVRAEQHAAVYMEGVFKPGMASEVHRHPGVEAWHTVSGEMCVETPKGRFIQRPGDPAIIVPAGQPMELIGTGGSTRESLVLILQDASQPRSTTAHDWTPKGLCRK